MNKMVHKVKPFRLGKRKTISEVLFHGVISAIFAVVALSYVYILVWTIISSLKTNTEVVMDPFSLPAKWNFKNYAEMVSLFTVNGNTFWNMLFNSVWFSVVGAFLQQFTTITFAYCCTKYKFPGSRIIYPLILVIMTLPIYGSAGAQYRLIYSMGMIDTYAHVLLSITGFNVSFLYYRAYFKNISSTYVEAAQMDGANEFSIYLKIMLPQAKPIFTALFLTTWLASWNSYESALLYLPNLPTLPVGIYKFNQEMIFRNRLDILFCACLVVTIPALILFVIFNKSLTTNVSVGGIKG